jgi:hypothetical protein
MTLSNKEIQRLFKQQREKQGIRTFGDIPWEYSETDYDCPDCGEDLVKVDVSTMLKCFNGHGPYFIV